MAETVKRWTTLEAVVQQCRALEIKLLEAKAELDELDFKQRRVEIELARLRQNGLWGWLFPSLRPGNGWGPAPAANPLDLYSKPGLPRLGF